uniref:Uncharacterized protein n=1 Tax=Oryza brachyantha TaxID=4533 RepID=J3N0H4_ORYBR
MFRANQVFAYLCLLICLVPFLRRAGRSKFGSLLSLGHDHTKLDKLYMRGPEGRGEVEVAVSGIADQSHERSKKDPGDSFRVLVRRAASAASKLAKHAYEAGSTNKRSDDELLPLKYCLISVSLPWDYIAHDLLHKVKSISTCK